MLVTNPALRAPLSEILAHPWMIRGFSGPPENYLLHREPLRADELDRQVIHGMKGFEFGSDDDIEKKLVAVLESDSYIKAVQYWERKRGLGGGSVNGYGSSTNSNGGSKWGPSSMSNSSLAISFTSDGGTSYNSRPNTAGDPTTSSGGKKSKRFSGFDFYRRKLFSPNSPSTSPSSSNNPFSTSSPPQSQTHLISHGGALVDAKGEPLDPTKGFHPLISMYFLAREKMEREKVYGPGAFASSQLSIADAGHNGAPPNGTVNGGGISLVPGTASNGASPSIPERREQFSAPLPISPPVPILASPPNAKADYSMPLPRLPPPETSHYGGMGYDTAVATPSPTSPSFNQTQTQGPQARTRDPGGVPSVRPEPSEQQAKKGGVGVGAGAGGTLPRAPPASTHRRSHSLSQKPTTTGATSATVGRGWGGMFNPPAPVDEMGEKAVSPTGGREKEKDVPPASLNSNTGASTNNSRVPHTAGPQVMSFAERERQREEERERDRDREKDHGGPLTTGATLVRKFGSMLVGRGDERRHNHGRKGTILGGIRSPSPGSGSRPSGDAEKEKKSADTNRTNLSSVEWSEKDKVVSVDEKAGEKEKEGKENTPVVADEREALSPKLITHSQSQPLSSAHRRAATILDPSGSARARHERRSSTGGALLSGSAGIVGGSIGRRSRRPSTGYSGMSRPLAERLFSRMDEEGEVEEKNEGDGEKDRDTGGATSGDEHTDTEAEDDRHAKPIFLKGLFRCVI